MTDEPHETPPFTLRRWSQRKLAATRTPAINAEIATPPAAEAAALQAVPAEHGAVVNSNAEPASLPPVESLTFESDYSAFMQPKIDEATKRAALKKLFSDPSFNVMDGLDIYVGDYTQADPMPTGMLEKLSAVYAMLDPVAPPADDNEADRASDKNVATPNADAVVESVPIAPITPAAPATQALPLGDAAMPDTDAVNSAPDSDDPAPTKRQ